MSQNLSLLRVPPFQSWRKMKILVIHMETPILDVETCLRSIKIPFLSIPYNEIAVERDIKSHLNDCVGIIITGSRKVNHKLPELPRSVSESNLPKLGICYGHEVLGELLGANIVNCNPPMGEYGQFITKLYPSVLFRGMNIEDETVEKMEHFYMLDKLPSGCKLIASTKLTEISGFECTEKGIFGLQFHIEKGFNGDLIFKNYFDFCVRFTGTNHPQNAQETL